MSESSKKAKGKLSPGGYIDGIVFEEVEGPNGPVYARSDEPNKFDATFRDFATGETYEVLPKWRLKYKWKLPPEPLGYKDELSLFETVLGFYRKYVDLKDERAYFVITAFTIASWRLEDFRAVPYIFFLGPTESGKTTTLETLRETCYRAYGGESITVAAIASMVDRYSSTVMMDESQVYSSDKEEMAEAHAILRGGYRREGMRIKMAHTGKDWIERGYRTFSFKILASKNPLEEALALRCLTIHMAKTSKKLPKTLLAPFYEEGLQLRGMLLSYRFRRLGNSDFEEVQTELEANLRSPRLCELGLPLLAVTSSEFKNHLLSFLRDQEKARVAEEETGEEADYVRAVRLCVTDNKLGLKGFILSKDFRDALMSVSEITDPKFLDSPKTNRKILDRLGFRRARTSDGTGFIFEEELQKRLEARFTPTPPEPTQPTQPTFQSENEVKVVKVMKDTGGYGLDLDSEDLDLVRDELRQQEARIGYGEDAIMIYHVKERSNGRIDADRYMTLIRKLADSGEVRRFAPGSWKLT